MAPVRRGAARKSPLKHFDRSPLKHRGASQRHCVEERDIARDLDGSGTIETRRDCMIASNYGIMA